MHAGPKQLEQLMQIAAADLTAHLALPINMDRLDLQTTEQISAPMVDGLMRMVGADT